jgi:hypothetical protein
VLGLRVARLGLWLDARSIGLHMVAPPLHTKFLQGEQGFQDPFSGKGDLVLHVKNATLPETIPGAARLSHSENWELWLDEHERFIFLAPRQSPPVRVVVEPGFTTGELLGDFSSSAGADVYPLEILEIRFFANWLATFGDVILHASGVVVDGKGYAFIGPAGAGKSTLAASLLANHAALVLGEDTIILRCLEDRFWIYGTPWHLDPDMCSSHGAPLEKLFFLDKAAPQGVERLTPADGITRILQTAFIPYYLPKALSAILDRLGLLAERVPFHSLSYPLGFDAWKLICQI